MLESNRGKSLFLVGDETVAVVQTRGSSRNVDRGVVVCHRPVLPLTEASKPEKIAFREKSSIRHVLDAHRMEHSLYYRCHTDDELVLYAAGLEGVHSPGQAMQEVVIELADDARFCS